MSSEFSKGLNVEIPIFHAFITHGNFSIDPSSVQKRNPPEPDILCKTTEGEIVAFELVELCDGKMAKNRADGTYIRTSDPSFDIVKRKLNKRYVTDAPIELICYKNGRIVSPDRYIAELLAQLLLESTFQYRRVWLLNNNATRLLWPLSSVDVRT